MNKLHKIIAASLLASATTVGSGVVLADSPLTANVGVTSNYIWRGATQSSDTSAVSGGIDYAMESGFYVGTWVSNESWTTPAGYEQDLYAGYGFKAGPVDLDIGYISYMYPVGTAQDDFAEAYLNATLSYFTAGVAYTTSKEAGGSKINDIYTSLNATFEVKKGLTLAITAGNYNFEDSATPDYNHYQLALSKGDFTLAYDKTDSTGTAGDPRVTASWSHSIDL